MDDIEKLTHVFMKTGKSRKEAEKLAKEMMQKEKKDVDKILKEAEK